MPLDNRENFREDQFLPNNNEDQVDGGAGTSGRPNSEKSKNLKKVFKKFFAIGLAIFSLVQNFAPQVKANKDTLNLSVENQNEEEMEKRRVRPRYRIVKIEPEKPECSPFIDGVIDGVKKVAGLFATILFAYGVGCILECFKDKNPDPTIPSSNRTNQYHQYQNNENHLQQYVNISKEKTIINNNIQINNFFVQQNDNGLGIPYANPISHNPATLNQSRPYDNLATLSQSRPPVIDLRNDSEEEAVTKLQNILNSEDFNVDKIQNGKEIIEEIRDSFSEELSEIQVKFFDSVLLLASGLKQICDQLKDFLKSKKSNQIGSLFSGQLSKFANIVKKFNENLGTLSQIEDLEYSNFELNFATGTTYEVVFEKIMEMKINLYLKLFEVKLYRCSGINLNSAKILFA